MKRINKITLDDLRTYIYKERIQNNITSTQQATELGVSNATQLGHLLYYNNKRDPFILRLINYILKKRFIYEETNQNSVNH